VDGGGFFGAGDPVRSGGFGVRAVGVRQRRDSGSSVDSMETVRGVDISHEGERGMENRTHAFKTRTLNRTFNDDDSDILFSSDRAKPRSNQTHLPPDEELPPLLPGCRSPITRASPSFISHNENGERPIPWGLRASTQVDWSPRPVTPPSIPRLCPSRVLTPDSHSPPLQRRPHWGNASPEEISTPPEPIRNPLHGDGDVIIWTGAGAMSRTTTPIAGSRDGSPSSGRGLKLGQVNSDLRRWTGRTSAESIRVTRGGWI